jgi:hypothetical protein
VYAHPSEHTDRLVTYLLKVVPESLETRNFEGYTPLHLACKLGRLSIAKILIDAGANQATRDYQANNLLHSALTYLPKDSEGKSVKLFDQILDLLEPELLSSMFLARNSSVTMTGATPLHAFIQQNYGSGFCHYDAKWKKQHMALVKMLLRYSKGAELGIINGSGDLPLHTLITAKSRTLAKVLLNSDPQLLCIENAVGRTPVEVAQDQYLAERFSSPPTVIQQRWGQTADSEDLVNRGPEKFVPGYNVDKRQETEKMWDLVNRYIAKNPNIKRKLVSLNEANEVAKRLGEMSKKKQRLYRRSSRRSGYDEEEDNSDSQEQGGDDGDLSVAIQYWEEYNNEQEQNEESYNRNEDDSDESDY